MKRLFLSLVLSLILFSTGIAEAVTYYYAKPCASYPCSGTDPWDTPAKAGDIRTVFTGARTDANPDTVIRLTEGTYDLSVPDWGYYTWAIAVDLTIEGHDGTNSLTASQVIIDGKETHTFFQLSLDGISFILQNVTVKNCVNTASSSERTSLYMARGVNLTVADCIFDNNFNSATGGGAAILTHPSNVTGAIAITGSTFSNNTSSNGVDRGTGGAVKIRSGTTLTMSDCIFTSNNAWTHGGALYVHGLSGAISISDCDFTSNSVIGTNDAIRQGGAVIVTDAGQNATIQDCTFRGNTILTGATAAGALKFSSGAYGTIQRCYFDSNSAAQGGAIDFGGTTAVTSNLYHSVFVNNAAIDTGEDISHGGAWHSIMKHSVNAYNNIYYGNTADNYGSAVAPHGVDSDATATLTNEIYHTGSSSWGDISDLIHAADTASNLNITYCDIEGGADSVTNEDTYEHNINADPRFYSASADNFTLRRNSPCIDTGTDVSLTYDLNGWRVDSSPDMGAYEYYRKTYGGIHKSVAKKTSGTVLKVEESGLVNLDSTNGVMTIYMPPLKLARGVPFFLSKDNAGNNITLMANEDGVTISGAASKTLTNQYDSIILWGGTDQWYSKTGGGSGSYTGTSDEIDITGDAIGIADNAILPGNEKIRLPGGTTAQRPAAPSFGDTRYNGTIGTIEWYDSAEFVSLLDFSDIGTHVASLSSPTFTGTVVLPNTTIPNGSCLRLSTTTTAHSWAIQAYDVNDAVWRDLLTFTNADVPTVSIGTNCKLDGLSVLGMSDSGIPANDGEFGYDSGNFIFQPPSSGGMDLKAGGTYKVNNHNVLAVNTLGQFSTPITTNPYTLTAANLYNSSLYYGATGEIDVAAGVDGMSTIIYNTGSFTITIDPNGTQTIVRDGTLQAAGVSITLSSGAGNYVCMVYDGATWVTKGFKGTLGAGS